ncbi:MAG TPA: type II toxin-antitoxin system RelE/ParE family toxin [Propionibacteriaceae bacterium]|jgi:toxin HigB-1|nr:type II toxin-antitoxin system RelE/ParE family toxin [Propionibacteriaceae bacterium]
MIASFRNRALSRYWLKNDRSKIRPDWMPRLSQILQALEAAHKPEALDLPGLSFHRLRADQAGRFAVSVSRNWRITYGWDGENAIDVDLEDYHG